MQYRFFFLFFLMVYAGVNAQPRNLRQAERALQKGKLLKAQKNIIQATEHAKTQTDPKTWLLKGKIYEAIALDTTHTSSMDLPSPTDEAVQAFQKSIALSGSDKLTRLYAEQALENFYHQTMDIALRLADNEQYQAVWEQLEKAKRILPQQPNTYLFEGRLALARKKYQVAKENFSYLINQLEYTGDGLSEIVRDLINIQLLTHGSIDSSLIYLNKAQQLLPEHIDFYEKEIALLLQAGQVQQAEAALQDKNFPTSLKPKMLATIAGEYRQQDKPGKAIEIYQEALQYDPDDSQLLRDIADTHRQLAQQILKQDKVSSEDRHTAVKQYEQALHFFELALEKEKDSGTLENIQMVKAQLEALQTVSN